MDFDQLSQNGIQKLLNSVPSVVQIVDFQVKQKNNATFFVIEISDGFAKLKKGVIMPETGPVVKKFDIIRSEQVTASFKDGKPVHVLIDVYTLVRDDINNIIGDPIDYLFFDKNKSNPKGDNMIPPKKGNGKPQIHKKPSEADITQSIPYSNKPSNDQQAQRAQHQQNQQQNKQSNTNTNGYNKSSNNTNIPAANIPQKNVQRQQGSNDFSRQRAPQPTKQNYQQVKPSETRHDRDHTMIKELYEGMEDWKVKVRVLFRGEVRTYIKKANGQESQVFSFEACDRFDSIEFSAFGEAAGNFGNVIDVDNIYEIAGGKVSKDDQKNKLKIMLNQKSIINLLEDDLTIPTAEDFCITPQKLLQRDVGTEWNVIALVKDINPVIEFISKNGKKCRKKDIYLCDPEAEIQVPLTLWFQKADMVFEKVPYAFQGITVSQFKDQKQYATSLRFSCRPYKNHQYRKFVATFQKMKFENPVEESTNKSKPKIELVNFHVLKEEAEKLNNFNTLTIQKVCYLTQISSNGKNFYLSCPLCKRKVIDEQNGVCISEKCGKPYQKGKYRYLLNVALTDEISTIWATAYDQAAEAMLTSQIDGQILTADEFAKISEEDLKLKMPQFLDREMKVSVTAKKETFNGNEKIKFGINKASLQIDYTFEASVLTKQIDFLMSSMQ